MSFLSSDTHPNSDKPKESYRATRTPALAGGARQEREVFKGFLGDLSVLCGSKILVQKALMGARLR